MSLLERLFGSEKGEPSPQDAILQKLRETEERWNKKSEFLEAKITEELKKAKQCGTKNKRAALQHLKHKKCLEKQLQNIDRALSTIELQREALKSATTNIEAFRIMEAALQALKSAQQGLNVSDVHDLDDLQKQYEIADKEIQNAISQPVGFDMELDEDELLDELEELEREDLEKEILDIPPIAGTLPDQEINLPSVSTTVPKAKAKEDDELAALADWAN